MTLKQLFALTRGSIGRDDAVRAARASMPALLLMLLFAAQGTEDPKAKLEAAAGPLPLPRGVRYVPDCSRKLSDAQGVPVAVFTFGAKANADQHALLHGQTPKDKTVALNVADAAEKKTLAPARAYYERNKRNKWKEQQPGNGIYEASDDSWVATLQPVLLAGADLCPASPDGPALILAPGPAGLMEIMAAPR